MLLDSFRLKTDIDASQIWQTECEGIFSVARFIIDSFGRTRVANKIDRVVHNMLYS